MLERIQRKATKMIPELKYLGYEIRLLECRLTTIETRVNETKRRPNISV